MFPSQSSPPKQERGQVLVLVALVLVILFGFAGVAIDGGNLYTEQRRAQAAADNAVLAAAFAQMKGATDYNQLKSVAEGNAAINAYNNNKTDNWVTFHRPPLHGGHKGDSNYMEVMITRSVTTALVHFVYQQNPVAVTVYAVAHGKYSEPIMAGFAIATMHTTCDANLFTFRGNGNAIIKDGGIFVNAPPGCPNAINLSGSNLRIATTTSAACPNDELGPTQPGGCYINGAFPIRIGAGGQNEGQVCGTPSTGSPIQWWDGQLTDCNLYPQPQSGTQITGGLPSPISTSDFTCGLARTTPSGNGTHNLLPGTYADGLNGSQNSTLILEPGIYCITGTGSANKILTADSIIAKGVFFYVSPYIGKFSSSGGLFQLTAPRDGENGLNCTANPNDELCNVQGLLYFKPNGPDDCNPNNSEINFSGQGTVIIRGLIWAPKSFMDYTGQGNLYMSGQAIVGCGKVAGSDSTENDITYNPEDSFIPPPSVQLDN